ncbi:alpha/beta hydrolase [Geotalea toluenoxydans]
MASVQSVLQKLKLKYNKPFTAPSVPLEKLRAMQEDAAERIPLPKDVRTQTVVAGGVDAEWVHPHEAPKEKVLMYLHGGAYVMGSCNTHRALAAQIARACGMRALVLDYRLAPEHPCPAAIHDSVAAYRWLLHNGIQPGDLVIAGDSAGGGLALATLLSLRDSGEPMPAAAVCITPWADLTGMAESVKTRAKADPCLWPDHFSFAGHYAGAHDRCDPLLSPLYADLSGLPPLLIQAAGDHILLSDSTGLAQRAKDAGVAVTLEVWQGMWHAFHLHAPQLPEARSAIEAIGSFVGRQLETRGLGARACL